MHQERQAQQLKFLILGLLDFCKVSLQQLLVELQDMLLQKSSMGKAMERKLTTGALESLSTFCTSNLIINLS